MPKMSDAIDTHASAAPVFPLFAKKSKSTFEWSLRAAPSRPATCLYGSTVGTRLANSKIAAFDLDGTLINPKGKSSHPKDAEDWKFIWGPNVVQKKIQQAHADGWSIVIFTNQNHTKHPKNEVAFKQKVKDYIAPALGVPLHVFAASAPDAHRKPFTGMFQVFQQLNEVKEIDYSSSFYVGDAAGRAGDWTDTDRKFALNAGLNFFTPEEYFLNEAPRPFSLRGFNINTILSNADRCLITPNDTPMLPAPPRRGQAPSAPEIVLFVGYPASGKSELYSKYFSPRNYVHVNQDTIPGRSRNACEQLVETTLQEGKRSIVVDNTNRNKETRAVYVRLAKKYGAKIRCFVFDMDMRLAWHNNLFRAFAKPVKNGEDLRSLVPLSAFSDFRRMYEKPELDEGFDEIRNISMMFESDDPAAKKAYESYLCLGGAAHQKFEEAP